MLRLPYLKIAPEGFRPFRDLAQYLEGSSLGTPLLNLVYLRVSQINGCSYCTDTHWRDARSDGHGERKLNGVLLWREMPFFDQRERAALAWAEAVTRLERGEVTDADFAAAREVFEEKELVDLTFAIAHMNALNRVGIAFHLTPAVPASPAVEIA